MFCATLARHRLSIFRGPPQHGIYSVLRMCNSSLVLYRYIYYLLTILIPIAVQSS
jgi:hypothetical protein